MDGTLRIWYLSSAKELRQLEHRDGANDVKVSPDGRRALSAGRGDKSVRLWDLATGTDACRYRVSYASRGR
jgi:WD40 repeat protein